MSDQTQSPLHQALDDDEQALQRDLSVPEEFARSWTDYMATTTVPDNWFTKSSGVVTEMIPAFQVPADKSLRLFEERSRVGLELVKRAIRVTNAHCLNSALEELQLLFEASLEGLRNGTHGMVQFNVKAVDCWAEFLGAGISPASKRGKLTRSGKCDP